MYERLNECPNCKSEEFRNHMICKDFSVSQESFAIVKCKKCELLFTNPRPTIENLHKYYQSENYVSHANKSNSPINAAYKFARLFTLNNKVKLVKKFHKNGNLLDYGCGTGAFLNVARKNGFNVTGYEPSSDAHKEIDKTLKPSILDKIDDLTFKKHFHIITLWHVLEHISDLSETVERLKKMLHPEGRLIIAVPNNESYDATYYKEYWAAYDLPRHLYHFTPKTIKGLLSSHKLRIESTDPMPLDSFYVSLLSEKYKTGSSNYVKAISIGLKSNKMAKKTNDYSSLIYIVKRS